MKTEEILNEREKTHGDFKRLCELVGKLRELSLVYRREGQSATQQIALEMIYLKLARIICGDPNHVDHWDDIAGYAMLGKGKEEKDWFKSEPCKHDNKKRQFYSDTAQQVNSVMTADHCLECAHIHIVDFKQKEGPKEAFKEWKCIGCKEDMRVVNERCQKPMHMVISNWYREREPKEALIWYDAKDLLPKFNRWIIAECRNEHGEIDCIKAQTKIHNDGWILAFVDLKNEWQPISHRLLRWRYDNVPRETMGEEK